MSLRSFHILFVLVCMVFADVFGVMLLRDYGAGHSPVSLLAGAGSLLGGAALIVYGAWLVRKLDHAHIH